MEVLRSWAFGEPGGTDGAGGYIPADGPTHDSAPADGSTSADMSGDGEAAYGSKLWAVLKMQRIWRGRYVRAESDLGAAFWKVVAEARPPKQSAGKHGGLGQSPKRSPKR